MRYWFSLCLMLLASAALAETSLLPLDRVRADRTEVGQLAYRGALVLPPSKGRFGGLSGLAVAPDGKSLIALTDNNRIFRLQLKLDGRGWLKSVTPDAGTALADEADAPKNKGKGRIDSEALAALPDGWLIAYERQHRVEWFADKAGLPSGVPKAQPSAPAEWVSLPDNSGLESLAAWPDGRLLAIAEAKQNSTNPAWLWQDGNWHQLRYTSASGFAPSDAAVLPDGDVVVLERGFNLFFGFRARLVRVKVDTINPGAVLVGEELARLENPLITENFEGLAAGKGPSGQTRLYIVSDNNFNAAQQTILAVFDLISPTQTPR